MANIRNANLSDAAPIAEIYNYYILNEIATFEEEPLQVVEVEDRIRNITEKYPWIVYVDEKREEGEEEEVLGYAYAGPFHPRTAYRHTAEFSIYLRKGQAGRGIGSALLDDLLERLKNSDLPLHSLIGGVALPNDASVRLHEKFGFEKVSHYREAGYKFSQWIDVAYWQKML